MMRIEDLPLHRVVTADGIEIHYKEAGSGTPLVFVHGGMGDWSSWAPQWSAFTPHFRCISYSRRYSSPNENPLRDMDHSVIKEARDLAALLTLWNAEPAILVGTSYGAYVALQFALENPAAVTALALTEPPVLPWADRVPQGKEARVQFERDVLAPSNAAFASGDAERAVRLLTDGILAGRSPEAKTEAGLSRRRRNARAMHALAISAQPYPPLDAALAAALQVPTLLTHGEHTPPIHRATTAAVHAAVPGARVVEVPDSGHGVHRDNPAAFNALVLGFLSGHVPGRQGSAAR